MESIRLSWNFLPWNFSSIIGIIADFVAVLAVIVPLCLKFKRNNNINRDLKKWLSRDTIKSLNCYVNTRGQQVDPSENDEIIKNQDFSFTKKLIPFFIKDVFKNKIPNQYYIILGDSGMGKTTFMIKLYKNYKQKWFKRFNMELIPLLYTNALTKIDEIEDQEKTILLLDGLDENPSAMKNYEAFMHELIDKTEMFNKVIITCRTQFFPNEKAEPYETGKIMFATENKNNVFYKIYISPFSNKDIIHYLKKKFRVKKRKRKKAKQIIEKCPYLMVRPMLLSYIDDLIISKREYKHLFQIYEQLVENWIRREAVSSEALHSFTKQTAIKMYCNNSIYISSKEMEELCEKYNINLKNIEARSKSLLNRNGIGQYKFAHKSIYEYVLAKEALEDADFRKIYDFTHLDMAGAFLDEMIEYDLKDALLVASDIRFNFSRLHISNINFRGINFTDSIFNEAIFENCKFNNCKMHYIKLVKCKFINCDMTQISLIRAVGEELQFNNCILEYANFNRTIFKNCDIISSNLSRSLFYYANIFGSKFIKSNIAHSDLSNSNFYDSVLEDMILSPLIYNNFKANSEVLNDIITANKGHDNIKEVEPQFVIKYNNIANLTNKQTESKKAIGN